ncbi:MAG: hypothetical protein WC815_01535 [Vicinamibacterales bacterium]
MTSSSARLAVRLIAAVSLAGIAAAYLSVIRPWGGLVSTVVLGWFILPGVTFARILTRSADTRAHWLLGPVWGVGISVLGLLALWQMGGRGAWILILAPWPLWLLNRLPLQRIGIDLRMPRLDRRDLVAVLLLFLLVPLIAGAPFARVAEPVDDGGKAYRAYFTADFVWAMTVVAEVSKGDIPPKNPFQFGGTLHYYWLAHFLSAVEYRVLGPWGLTIEEVTLANSLAYGLVFIAFLYGFVRAFGATAGAAATACALVFLANSYEALDRLVVWWSDGAIIPLLGQINVDAVTRWFYSGMPVDGLHRMLLYQPHHLGGYAIGLSALLIVARTTDAARPLVALTIGSFLALSLLLTSFEAIIIGVAVSIVYAFRLLAPSRWKAIPLCAILGAVPVFAAFEVSEALAYVDPAAKTLVRFGPNPVALMHWQYVLLLSFGPMLILGAIGALVAVVGRRSETLPIAALAAVALGFYFLTDVPDMQHVWVGWRAGHLLFVSCTVFTAVLLTSAHRAPLGVKVAAWALVGVLAVAALPTVAMDIYNAQDITNTGPGPGFPWTLVLSRDEVEALNWLKTQTPPDVIVQPNVAERANASWGYIPAFGERRMAAGLPIAMIPMQPYQDASTFVGNAIFGQADPKARALMAQQLHIDYLYVGPAEQERHSELVASFDSRSDLFPVAFRNREVVIYLVAH